MDRVLSVDPKATGVLPLAGFELDLHRGELRRPDGQNAELRRQALDVLLVLGEHAGHVVGKDELIQRIWPDVIVTEDSLVQAVADIRRVLGDAEHRLVRTAKRRGYMLAPTALPIPVAAVADRAPPAPPAEVAAGLAANRLKLWLLLLCASAVLLALAAWWWLGHARISVTTTQPPQIAVLAFRDRAGTPDGALLGRGVAEDVILQLGRNQGLNVVSRHSSFSISGKDLPAAELGRQLSAQYLVDGRVQRTGERLSIDVELIDTRADKVLWVSQHESEGGQIVQARDAIVERIAGTLFSKLRESERRLGAGHSPKTLDVYVLTMRGLHYKHRFTPEATREGRAVLQRALAIDPNYAPAWFVLGWLNAIDGLFNITGEWGPARADEAIAQAKRSIELAPGDAEAWLLHGLHLLRVKPPEQGLQAIRRAREMYPIAPVYFEAMHSYALWANGQSDASLVEAESCTRRAPFFRGCRVQQALIHSEAGRIDAAHEQIAALGAQAVGLTSERACGLYAGDRANVERCRKLVQAAGLPP